MREGDRGGDMGGDRGGDRGGDKGGDRGGNRGGDYSPHTGGGEEHQGHHQKKAGLRWGTPRASPPSPPLHQVPQVGTSRPDVWM